LNDKNESKDDIKDVHHEDHLFVFKYTRNNENYLQNAKDLLVQYLTNRQIEVYEDDIRLQRSSSESISDTFPHFNGRILSSVGGGKRYNICLLLTVRVYMMDPTNSLRDALFSIL